MDGHRKAHCFRISYFPESDQETLLIKSKSFLNPTTTQMLNLSQHCANVALLINTVSYYDAPKLQTVYSWLRLATGLKTIEFDTSLFDDGCGEYCSEASIFDSNLEISNKRFVNHITRFLIIWNAIEALKIFIQPSKLPKQDGKINRLCNYISSHNKDEISIINYTATLQALHKVLSKTFWNLRLMPISKIWFATIDSYGLYLAYKIRCAAAHGDNLPPNSPYSHCEKLSGASVFPIASRICLFSIQKIMLVWALTNSFEAEDWNHTFSDDDEEFDFVKAIQSAHLPAITQKRDQYSLFES